MNVQTLPTTIPEKAGEIMEAVMIRGDLAQLRPEERAKYYTRVCESIGLNPLTKPFEYITLNNKLTLYARKDATDQLRKIYGVSVIDMTEAERDGIIIVTVKVKDAAGRTDMAKGAVTLKGLQGEALANAFMKCETKAKRRATLSICGLGFLDETEIETIPNAKRERLPKKDAREIYKRMQDEVDKVMTRAEFDAWCEENEPRTAILPEDWEDILRLRIQERRLDLARAEEPPVEEVIWSDETPPEWDSAWEKLGPVKQAGVLCSDEAFWKFLGVPNEMDATERVRSRCNITSRKELASNNDAAKLWRNIVAEYRAWQREPSVIEPSPHRPPSPPTDAAEPATPAQPDVAASAGVADVPSADEYVKRWTGIVSAATSADQLGKEWNAQRDLRNKITWTDDNQFSDLKARVGKAIEFLKTR